jgi:hypothetical protein
MDVEARLMRLECCMGGVWHEVHQVNLHLHVIEESIDEVKTEHTITVRRLLAMQETNTRPSFGTLSLFVQTRTTRTHTYDHTHANTNQYPQQRTQIHNKHTNYKQQ